MESGVTPVEVVQRRRQVMLDHDADGFAGLFAPDAVIEMPTAGPGAPQRVQGRAIIEEFARRAATGMHIDDFETVAVHETADPEVVIAETVTRATVNATGKSFTTPASSHAPGPGAPAAAATADRSGHRGVRRAVRGRRRDRDPVRRAGAAAA